MALIRFSTRDYARPERLEASRDMYAAMAHVALDVARGEVPDIQARIRLLPGVSVALVECSSLSARRGAAQLADGSDDISLMLNPGGAGGWISHQRHHGEQASPVGFGCVGYNDLPGRVDFKGPRARFLSVAFSRDLLAPRVADLDRRASAALVPDTALRFMTQLALDLVDAPVDELAPEGLTRTAGELLDMATLSLGGTPEARDLALRRGLAPLRLRAIKGDMAAHAGYGGLSLGWIARRHGVSAAYVRKLFEGDGTSFTDYLLELRLQRVYRQLGHPGYAARTTSALVFEAGFNNLSWFYRAFKRRFGVAPGEVRAGMK
ncbi:MAG: AraC family transcriptional regulator [Alcanivorax sp.]|nr:AraC family transcriptional regulator [Alcanivorax sp.]